MEGHLACQRFVQNLAYLIIFANIFAGGMRQICKVHDLEQLLQHQVHIDTESCVRNMAIYAGMASKSHGHWAPTTYPSTGHVFLPFGAHNSSVSGRQVDT